MRAKEIDWQRDWFRRSKHFWENAENQRNFIDKIVQDNDVSLSNLTKSGGNSLLRYYQNSFHNVIKILGGDKSNCFS